MLSFNILLCINPSFSLYMMYFHANEWNEKSLCEARKFCCSSNTSVQHLGLVCSVMWSEAINRYFSCASIEMWITLVDACMKDLVYNLYESAAIANAFWESGKSTALSSYLWAVICKVQNQTLQARLFCRMLEKPCGDMAQNALPQLYWKCQMLCLPRQLLAPLFLLCRNNLVILVPCRNSEISWVLSGWQPDRKHWGIPWSQQCGPANDNELCAGTVHLKRAGGSGRGFLLYPVSWAGGSDPESNL